VRINGYNIDPYGDHWTHIYSYLKATNGQASTDDILRTFRVINSDAIAQGITEYNLMAERSNGLYKKMEELT